MRIQAKESTSKLTKGKFYKVIRLTVEAGHTFIRIKDDHGKEVIFSKDKFNIGVANDE